jgi:hypothetical protein
MLARFYSTRSCNPTRTSLALRALALRRVQRAADQRPHGPEQGGGGGGQLQRPQPLQQHAHDCDAQEWRRAEGYVTSVKA